MPMLSSILDEVGTKLKVQMTEGPRRNPSQNSPLKVRGARGVMKGVVDSCGTTLKGRTTYSDILGAKWESGENFEGPRENN